MSVKYGKFEIPNNIMFEKETMTSTFARVIAEPFERGFGYTIGNAMRRMMLNSLEAPSIISVNIEGVPHEYMGAEGIIEDMTNIVLNFKMALLRHLPSEETKNTREPKNVDSEIIVTKEMIDENGGQYKVTFGDIVKDGYFEVVNPELHLFTVTKPIKKQVKLKVAIGRGYVTSERHDIQDKIIDEIVIDSSFSPVRLVNYHVEDTRVGQDTDYDKLIFEITTDGRVTPQEAISFAAQIGIKHLEVLAHVEEQGLIFEEGGLTVDTADDEMMGKLALRIGEIELSVRSTNCLSGAQIETIGELVVKPESEMLKFRNFGKKSLNEIKAKLTEMGLSLGMDLEKYGINDDNVRDIITKYNEEKKDNSSNINEKDLGPLV
ncbi:MAG: DNA-directed RNA polymerase subunit alpha [Waddliaceae bacterium]|jgi:DNA-directed RNA polymerase subunit alpha|nr:DNA-directed RNA polymerase subunit alpha [Waddliaceae bacterium]MBT3578639.1 DNA-directed RNA polymerase subunit alpha [Waddliaceae bacterium]MBT4445358.1 DNA-directed RNA polymerase subunit alpha [Waddliaceae bacterium]MBT6928374.1 DNA-directed RNA polymerase subunit alpha [Waddliaceae bacterium]MBT7265060.1 DNA-directed RNA polymerase subunit alpha [Waddliaceae bacterium]